jgi:hypothetical protein
MEASSARAARSFHLRGPNTRPRRDQTQLDSRPARGKTKPKLGSGPIIFRQEPMRDIVNTLGTAAIALPLIPLRGAAWETLDLSEGISVAVQQYRGPEDVTTIFEGEDLLKLHVQLSGQRILNFEGRHEIDIRGASTAVLMHDVGAC